MYIQYGHVWEWERRTNKAKSKIQEKRNERVLKLTERTFWPLPVRQFCTHSTIKNILVIWRENFHILFLVFSFYHVIPFRILFLFSILHSRFVAVVVGLLSHPLHLFSGFFLSLLIIPFVRHREWMKRNNITESTIIYHCECSGCGYGSCRGLWKKWDSNLNKAHTHTTHTWTNFCPVRNVKYAKKIKIKCWNCV